MKFSNFLTEQAGKDGMPISVKVDFAKEKPIQIPVGKTALIPVKFSAKGNFNPKVVNKDQEGK